MKYCSFLWILFFIANPLFSAPPKISQEKITFTYTNPHARDVKLLTSIDQYKTLILMSKNPQGVWEVSLDINQPQFQLQPGKYFYKFIVDNIYTADPENQEKETEPFSGEISVFKIESPLIAFNESPQKIGPLTYRFYFKNSTSWGRIQEIQFVGSFNQWQPYEYFLNKLNDDIWYIDFTFTRPGVYAYQYIINGKWVQDPFNPKVAYTQTGAVYSVVHAEN